MQLIDNFLNDLQGFIGTTQYFVDPNVPEINYTDGVKFVFDNAIDNQTSMIVDGSIEEELCKIMFKNKILNTVRDLIHNEFLTITLSNNNGLGGQGCQISISYETDIGRAYKVIDIRILRLKLDDNIKKIKMFCCDGILMLASEY